MAKTVRKEIEALGAFFCWAVGVAMLIAAVVIIAVYEPIG